MATDNDSEKKEMQPPAPKLPPIEIVIGADGETYGWCATLKEIGFVCPLGRATCAGCFCG